jgi:SNF2 family DNA or RNA helicase
MKMERFDKLLKHSGFGYKKHQYDGVEWCVNRELANNQIQNVRGGMIADEMGLGKTLQMIGTIYVNMLPNTLIVLPPVLIEQWKNEIYKASGHKALLYYGTNKKHITISQLKNARIVLTSYHCLIGKNVLLHRIKWSRIIFDEAHHLRNSFTKLYDVSNKLRSNIKWLITGTPIQNSKKDFHSLCYLLGFSPSFYINDKNTKTIVEQFILRRTKKQLNIYMTDIEYNCVKVNWKSKQERQLAKTINSLLPSVSNLQPCFSEMPLVSILRSRQVCIMNGLMSNYVNKLIKDGYINKEHKEGLHSYSKIDCVIDKILSRKYNGNGKIIFCHFREEIDVIEQRLKEGGITHIVKYDGRSNRAQLKTIGNKADVIILQIQTGCEGLNLQENYNEIYFVSPHWNPKVEEQAIARCHRIGQQKKVYIFRFIMSNFSEENQYNNIETYICRTQEKKCLISNEILGL